jgi:hypothetical protein
VSAGDAYDCVNGKNPASREQLQDIVDITMRHYLVEGGSDYLRGTLAWSDE